MHSKPFAGITAYQFLALIFFVSVLALWPIKHAQAEGCDNYYSWHTPSGPSYTYPDYGAFIEVYALYDVTTNCDGTATENAAVGGWPSRPTLKPSDGYTAKVEKEDTSGNKYSLQTTATSNTRGGSGTTGITQYNNSGSQNNQMYMQDTITCTQAGTTTQEIPFSYTFEYTTTATGTVL